MIENVAADTLLRLRGNAAPVAEARNQLAVIDREAAEGRFGDSVTPAKTPDLFEKPIGHRGTPVSG
jgi:hypothetical protein